MRRWLALAVVALAVGATACGRAEAPETSGPAPAAGLTTARDDRLGITMTFPSTWRRATRSLTPHLVAPVEVLTVGTAPLVPNDAQSRCAQHPTASLARLEPDDVLLTVQERRDGRPEDFPAGAPRIEDAARNRSEASACVGGPVRFATFWIPFRRGGRAFYAMAAIGDRATAGRRAAVQGVLDRLRVERRPVTDDRQRRVRYALPTGWRTYPFALTQAVPLRHQLAFGTFALEQEQPDPNCAATTALRARPPTGGLVFVFEYPDLNPRQLSRFPRRPLRFRLSRHDPRAYECFGPSSVLRWREEGRAFQAHLFADGRRVQEALGLLDSFDVHAQRR